MARAISASFPRRNRLLELLPPADYKRIFPRLKLVPLEHHQILFQARAVVKHVYFPVRGVASYLTVMESGAAIEVGSVGYEGVIGASAALVAPNSPHQVIIQVPGEGLRIEARVLVEEVGGSEQFRKLLARYEAAFLAQISQSVACNGLHQVGKRCCRWLLITHDRIDGDDMPLTHEFLGMMLGVRRASVTEVLGDLRDRGLIKYSRGVITVLDRKGLEAAACECYGVVEEEYDRLFA